MSFPLFSLPDEILQRVLELVKDDDVKSLAAFRLCSIKSKEASTRLFFQTISLQSIKDLEKRPWRDRVDDEEYLRNITDDHIPGIVEQLLDPNSDASLHVRHLCIGPWPEHRKEHPRLTQLRKDLLMSKYARILTACDGLRDFSWKMEISIPPSVLHVLHTKHPQCRLHISWKGKVRSVTNLEYIASPQLTTLEICPHHNDYQLSMDQISVLVSGVNRLESLSLRYNQYCYDVNPDTADHEPSSSIREDDPPVLNLRHLELGPWFQDSPGDIRSCLQTVNWAVLQSLELTCRFPYRLLNALKGQTPMLERLDIRLEFRYQQEGDQEMPDDAPMGTIGLVDFLSEAPLLNDLTFWVSNWNIWYLLWEQLPVWKGQSLRKLDLTWPSNHSSSAYNHSHQRYWTAGDLQQLVKKAPNIETLALELEIGLEESVDSGSLERELPAWPASAQEVLLQLTCLRELRLAVPLYGMNTAFTSAGWDHTVDLRGDATESILKSLYDAFDQSDRPHHLELLECVFWGRSWRMKTWNWRYTLERTSRSSSGQPRHRIRKLTTGILDVRPRYREYDGDPWNPWNSWDPGY